MGCHRQQVRGNAGSYEREKAIFAGIPPAQVDGEGGESSDLGLFDRFRDHAYLRILESLSRN